MHLIEYFVDQRQCKNTTKDTVFSQCPKYLRQEKYNLEHDSLK